MEQPVNPGTTRAEGDVPPPPPILLLTLAADDQGNVNTRFAPGVTPQQVAATLREVADSLDPQQGTEN